MKRIFLLLCLVASSSLAVKLPDENVDVVVVGGGVAGISAAIESGRCGAKTVLLEAGHQVGGNMTSGGVNFPGLFHAWGKQVIAGNGWDLCTNCVALAGGTLPDFAKPVGRWHWKHQLKINIPLYVALAEDALQKANVAIHYHASPQTIERTKDGWSVFVSATGDTRHIFCRQLVDCTGNGTVAAMSGCERMREKETMPGTFIYKISRASQKDLPPKELVIQRYKQAMASGELHKLDFRNGVDGVLNLLKNGGESANYISAADSSDADLRTQTNLRGRASMLRAYRFLKSLPGGSGVSLVSMSPETGIRETWRVKGEVVITQDDYTSGKVWDDALCFAFYPIDIHRDASGVQPAHLKEGTVATVPFRALIPAQGKNILVAGRCISADRGAYSALRVEATCMATGQAAGCAAALSALSLKSPAEVPLETIKTTLREHGAIVP